MLGPSHPDPETSAGAVFGDQLWGVVDHLSGSQRRGESWQLSMRRSSRQADGMKSLKSGTMRGGCHLLEHRVRGASLEASQTPALARTPAGGDQGSRAAPEERGAEGAVGPLHRVHPVWMLVTSPSTASAYGLDLQAASLTLSRKTGDRGISG